MEQLIDFHAPEVQAVLDTLLKDKSTGKNIIWATDPPEELQTVMYEPVTDRSQITTQQLGLCLLYTSRFSASADFITL